MINTKSNGGLNMIDISSFTKSLKCKWVKMYLETNHGSWKVMFDYALKKYGGKFLF